MQAARQKLASHRERALKKGVTVKEYAATLGLSPQRIGRLISQESPAIPTLDEALKMHKACRIKPELWLQN